MSDKIGPVPTLEDFIEERNALFRNPTLDGARIWWNSEVDGPPARPDVPLVAVHTARLQWLDATDAMLAESVEWLTSRGYPTTWRGAPPLTPERRDADRISLGKPPLAETPP